MEEFDINFIKKKIANLPGGGGALSRWKKIGLFVIGGLGVHAALSSYYNVEGGHRAIVFNRMTGLKDKVYPEGTHMLIPWIEKPYIFDVRAQPQVVESTSGSRDLQMVGIFAHSNQELATAKNKLSQLSFIEISPASQNLSGLVGLRVLTRPEPDMLPTIYRTLGKGFNEVVLPSIIHETLKAVIAQYNASQLLTQREAVSREIRKIVAERAAVFRITLDDVSITSLKFSDEFTSAIEAKQVAAQDAERAKFVVEKAEQDKKSAIIKAQGEAKSAELIGKSIAQNPAFITLRRIEASRDIAHTVAKSSNKVLLNSSDLLLNMGDN